MAGEWEYGRAIIVGNSERVTSVQGKLPRPTSEDLTAYMEQLGDAGWELVGVEQLTTLNRATLWFKKPK
jgi:hypothetical protein